MNQKSDAVLLEEVLRQAGVVLLKDPAITSQTRALSREGARCNISTEPFKAQPESMCAIEGRSTPDHRC